MPDVSSVGKDAESGPSRPIVGFIDSLPSYAGTTVMTFLNSNWEYVRSRNILPIAGKVALACNREGLLFASGITWSAGKGRAGSSSGKRHSIRDDEDGFFS